MRSVWALLLAAACSDLPDEVVLNGTVLDGPGGAPLGGATLTSYSEQGERHDDDASNGTGDFHLWAPSGGVVFVDVEAPGAVVTSHMGVTGISERQKVEEGAIFSVSQPEYDDWLADFEGCPTIGDAGGAVFGEVRVFDIVESGSNVHPLVDTAIVFVDDGRGETWEACYLDDAGEGYDPEAAWTGDTGRFAIFGVPEGEWRVTVQYQWVDDVWPVQEYPVRVPAEGVAPRIPLWVESAF